MLAGLGANIGNQQDFRIAGEQEFPDNVGFELSEPRAEFDVPLVRQVLSAKDDDEVVVKSSLNLPECRLIDVLCQIAGNLGAASSTAFRNHRLHRPSRSMFRLHVFLKHMRSDIGRVISEQGSQWCTSFWRNRIGQFVNSWRES